MEPDDGLVDGTPSSYYPGVYSRAGSEAPPQTPVSGYKKRGGVRIKREHEGDSGDEDQLQALSRQPIKKRARPTSVGRQLLTPVSAGPSAGSSRIKSSSSPVTSRFWRAIAFDEKSLLRGGADDGAGADGEESEVETELEYEESDEWRTEQIFLNAILKARNEYTLIPYHWAMHFRGMPLPEGLFYHKNNPTSLRPRIYAVDRRREYRGAALIHAIASLHARVRDFRREQIEVWKDTKRTKTQREVAHRTLGRTMFNRMRQVLEDAIRWALLDGDLVKYQDNLPPIIQVVQLPQAKKEGDNSIRDVMVPLARRWRRKMRQSQATLGPADKRPKAPVIYTLAIMNHFLIIASMDASNPEAPCHVPLHVNMAERKQTQWNALAVMVTICWARDKHMEVAKELKPAVHIPVVSDPDA